jgi:hypothetical protein
LVVVRTKTATVRSYLGAKKGDLMKQYTTRRILIVKLAALTLGTLCAFQTQAHAQEMTRQIVMFPSVGLAPGQTLRLTLFNPNGEPVRAQAQIHHTGGILVGLGDGSVRSVEPGGFQSFNFNRSEIPLSGEDRTGRIQLRASFTIEMAQPGKGIDGLAVSMETIEISDGSSNTILFAERFGKPQAPAITTASGRGGGTDVLVGSDARDVLMGIVPGQTLRVTIFNPPSLESGKGSESNPPSASGHVKIFDNSGSLLKQSDDVVIQSGEFRSFDFDRDALASPGEPSTNRKQVRVQPFFEFSPGRLRRVLASFEIVNNSTGKTEVLSGNQCLVFFLGGMPGK